MRTYDPTGHVALACKAPALISHIDLKRRHVEFVFKIELTQIFFECVALLEDYAAFSNCDGVLKNDL